MIVIATNNLNGKDKDTLINKLQDEIKKLKGEILKNQVEIDEIKKSKADIEKNIKTVENQI